MKSYQLLLDLLPIVRHDRGMGASRAYLPRQPAGNGETIMPFKSGMKELRFARTANMDPEKVQKALDDFQVALASAIISLGNTGCDPAAISDILEQVAEGVRADGYAAVTQVSEGPGVKEFLAQLPALNPEFAKMGGHGERRPRPAGFGDDLLTELGLRPRSPLEVN